jgi:hypothetical protein
MKARSTISRPATPLQRLELVHLVLVVGDDQLPRTHVRYAVTRAEGVHQVAPLHAQARLERAGGIVDARVNDAAVVGAGVHAWTRVALEQADRRAGGGDRAGRGQAGDASAYDRDVDLRGIGA